MNFIRGSHYPHNPAFADACDSVGICFWSEMCFWSSGSTSTDSTQWEMNCYPGTTAEQQSFDSNVIQQLTDMIKINRNHPSIVIWSMCNEVFFPIGGPLDPLKKALLDTMVKDVHLLDSTRKAAIGGAQRSNYYECGDVAGFNGDGATLYMDIGMPSLVSEYGSCQEDRPGVFAPCWGNLRTITDSTVNEYAWRSGISHWCGFHHGSNGNRGNKGMLDHARLPLERWYYYREQNLGIPHPTWPTVGTATKLSITVDRDTITDDGKSDVQVIVQIQNAAGAWLANTANITLTDNSGLGLFPSVAPAGGTSITFTANAVEKGVENGLCAIEYRGYNAGTATITASSSGLTSAQQSIVIRHVVDSPIVYLTGTLMRQAPSVAGQLMRQVRFVGNSLTIPQALRGRIGSVAIYTLQGRLIQEFPLKGSMPTIKIKNAADAALIARFTTR